MTLRNDVVNFALYFGSNEGITIVGSHRDIPDPETRAGMFPRFGSSQHTWSNWVAGWMETRLIAVDGSEITTAGEPGEMCVRGPAVFAGYYNDPAITDTSIDADGFYHTGDVFELAAEGDRSALLPFCRPSQRHYDSRRHEHLREQVAAPQGQAAL